MTVSESQLNGNVDVATGAVDGEAADVIDETSGFADEPADADDAAAGAESVEAEETDVEDAEPPIVVTVALPKEAVARIDALAAHPRGGPTRAEVLQRLLRTGLDAEEKAAADLNPACLGGPRREAR